MECSSCKARETVEHSDLESDVYFINEGIFRFCKRCGSSTFWKRASEDAEETPAMVEDSPRLSSAYAYIDVEEEPEPASATVADPKPATRQENRRKHVRTRANFRACVRSFAFGDDIVACEDISRGGLCFRSRKAYTVKFKVEVAAPYAEGVQNFFVPGEIVHVEETKEKMLRCGVAYLRSSRSR
jgi:hypothetical protein